MKEYVTETVQDFVSEICPFVLTINSSLWFFSYRHSKQLMYHFKICSFSSKCDDRKSAMLQVKMGFLRVASTDWTLRG